MTITGVQTELAAGQFVVLPSNSPHGFAVLEDGEAELIGELEMGKWVTVMHPDGSSREVEGHVESIPWHRPPPEGSAWMGMEEFFALVSGARQPQQVYRRATYSFARALDALSPRRVTLSRHGGSMARADPSHPQGAGVGARRGERI